MIKNVSAVMLMYLAALEFVSIDNNSAFAQVTADDTVNTQVDRQGNVAEITGGETRGNNLFHSFQDFSVPTANEAFFNNANDISNIFSRVTGGNISNIDGLIRANGSANLFLINPAGILFGEGARLDIGGSFYGSTATSILFEDGEFSATELDNPLLTINAPIGLGFRDNPGEIVNRANFGLTSRVLDGDFSEQFSSESFTDISSVGLEVDPDQTLALIGGDVVLENMSGITAPDGIVELGGLSAAGSIDLNEDGSLSYPDGIARGDVSLRENSEIEVRGNGGGRININAQNLVMSERSKLIAGIAEGQGSSNSIGGDITIDATDSIQLIGPERNLVGLGTEINNYVGTTPLRRPGSADSSDAIGNGGNIILNTSQLEISSQARITANSYSLGDGGDIVLNTDNITINGGAIAALVLGGTGDVGDVVINNTQDVVLNEGSNIQSQVLSGGAGDVGDVNINTENLAITERFSFILADNVSTGNGGDITIDASESVLIDGGGGENLGTSLSAILTQIQAGVEGDAGDITITTPELTLTNFGLISTSAREGSIGNTGDVFLNVETLTLNNGSTINALTENDFDGGEINLNANVVNLTNGGKIVTSGDRDGNAGSINLDLADSLTISSTNPPVQTPFLENILQSTASESGLFASTISGTGDGGSIEVRASSIDLADNGAILATTATGTGGNVSLQVEESIRLNNNTIISAEAGELGNGGNINIDANFLVAFPNGNSDITANARQGQGGNININAESLFGIEERALNDFTNDINASSEFNLDGSITIDTAVINSIEGAVELPQNVVRSQEITTQACQSNSGAIAQNGLIIEGKGGVPPEPTLPLNSFNLLTSSDRQQTSVPQPIATSQGEIQPARGIKLNQNGSITLTAYRTSNSGDRLPEIKPSCS